jgi:hypothetical protein
MNRIQPFGIERANKSIIARHAGFLCNRLSNLAFAMSSFWTFSFRNRSIVFALIATSPSPAKKF